MSKTLATSRRIIGAGEITNAMLSGGITDGKLASSYLYADGTRPLTANWNMGAFTATFTKTGATAATVYDAFVATNTTIASSGNQMYGGFFHSIGRGWATTPVADQTVDWRWGTIPVQGAVNPTGTLTFDHSVNGASFTTRLTLTTTGVLTLVGGFALSAGITMNTGQTFLFNQTGNINYNLTTGAAATGAIRFGDSSSLAGTAAATQAELGVGTTFAPASGSGAYISFLFNPTINQTGGANGITRCIYINPTLTAVADFRALEIAKGKTILAAPTTAYTSMNLPSGTAPSSPNDGDIWREDNTNTGFKIRINGVTKTITVS